MDNTVMNNEMVQAMANAMAQTMAQTMMSMMTPAEVPAVKTAPKKSAPKKTANAEAASKTTKRTSANKGTASKSKAEKDDDKYKFKIVKRGPILHESGNYRKELNAVSWDNRPAKWEIRTWYINDANEEVPNTGITLTDEELAAVYDFLKKMVES